MVSAAPAVNRLHGWGRIYIVAITILKLLYTSSDNDGTGAVDGTDAAAGCVVS